MTIRLRGGNWARDPRLGRVPQRDPRNAAYPISALDLPAGLVGRSWPIPIRLDQGQTPRCVGYSAAQELASYPVAVKATAALADEIYSTAQDLDEWPGSDYEGTSVLAGAKALAQLGYIDAYHWAESIDDVAAAVAHAGPVVVGLPWLDSMFDPRPSGLLDVSGSVAGGHAIEVRGILTKPRLAGEPSTIGPVFRLAQSWGAGWGAGGDCYMRADGLERLVFGGDGEAVAYVGERLVG